MHDAHRPGTMTGVLDETEKERAERRLALLELIAAGIERHQEVTQAVWEAQDRESAAQRLRVLFQIEDDTPPEALLDLQFGRLTMEGRGRLSKQVEELRRELGRP